MERPSLKFVILVALVQVVAGSKIARDGCQDECGGVKIPFPFGIGEGCFLEYASYEVACNISTNPPIPYIVYNDFSPEQFISEPRVLSINVDDHTLTVASKVAFGCYNNPYNNSITTTVSYEFPIYTSMGLSIPVTKNQFVAVGSLVSAQTDSSQFSTRSVFKEGTCTTFNSSDGGLVPGTCSGYGCCESSLFINELADRLFLSVYNITDMKKDERCYYAFIAQVGFYKFSIHDLHVSPKHCLDLRVPVVYDWSVTVSLANDEFNGVTPTCAFNATYFKANESAGPYLSYHCRCLQGYTGNPYLPHGCQDINECANKMLNVCEKPELCVNKVGGFDCLCKQGYHGNGTKSSPCNRDLDRTKIIIDLAIGIGSTISFIILYVAYKMFKRKKHIKKRHHNFKKNGGLLLQQEMRANEGVIDRIKIFTESDLVRATDNFNSIRVLGQGGQGTVYKGMLADGTIVAVKKSKKIDTNQVSQFINEVVILSQINHRNIVKLFGCCLETEVPLLVYEFIPNGTLYQYIHNPSEDFQMTWKVRSQIAVECAGAITYLHSSCSSSIHHRDIKSSNILLDENYKAKISDFGSSRSISIDMTHVTTRVQGTFGYLDPEFFRSSQFSEKSDVYRFGVVMLELITSKKPIYTDTSEETRSLAVEFVKIMETDNLRDQLHGIVDTKVLEHCSEEEIGGLLKLIKQCLSMSRSERPTMKEVTLTLEMIRSQYGEIEVEDQTNDEQRTMGEDGSLNSHEINITDDSSFSMEMQPFSFDSDL